MVWVVKMKGKVHEEKHGEVKQMIIELVIYTIFSEELKSMKRMKILTVCNSES